MKSSKFSFDWSILKNVSWQIFWDQILWAVSMNSKSMINQPSCYSHMAPHSYLLKMAKAYQHYILLSKYWYYMTVWPRPREQWIVLSCGQPMLSIDSIEADRSWQKLVSTLATAWALGECASVPSVPGRRSEGAKTNGCAAMKSCPLPPAANPRMFIFPN